MSDNAKKPAGFKLWGRVLQGQAAGRGQRDDKQAAEKAGDYDGLNSETYGMAINAAQLKLMELAVEAQEDGDDEAVDTLRYACDIVGQLSYENRPKVEDDEPDQGGPATLTDVEAAAALAAVERDAE